AMNDLELDELLNTWECPRIPPSLRDRVSAAVGPKKRTNWKMWLAATAATFVVAVLGFNTKAFPQKITLPPFTVESEINRYDERSIVESGPTTFFITSYNQDGSEMILSWYSHDRMLDKAVWETELALRGFIGKVTRRFLLTPEQIARREHEALVYPA